MYLEELEDSREPIYIDRYDQQIAQQQNQQQQQQQIPKTKSTGQFFEHSTDLKKFHEQENCPYNGDYSRFCRWKSSRF